MSAPLPDPSLPEPTCEMTPDGTFIFEVQHTDGRRAVAAVLPEDVDEIAGPVAGQTPTPEERRRRQRVARLLADDDLRTQLGGPDGAGAEPG